MLRMHHVTAFVYEEIVGVQNALKLKAGDILIFAKLPNGELLLGGRTRTSADKDRKAPPRARKGSEQGANGTPAAGAKRPRLNGGATGENCLLRLTYVRLSEVFFFLSTCLVHPTSAGCPKDRFSFCCAGGPQQRQKSNASPLMYRPLCDGVFRAVPPTISAREYCGKVLQQVCRVPESL